MKLRKVQENPTEKGIISTNDSGPTSYLYEY